MAATAPTSTNFIGGEWVDAASGETLRVGRPGDRRGARHRSRARPRPTSTAPSPPRRRRSRTGGSSRRPSAATILFRFAELLRERKAELTDLMTREMGKVKAEAGGDVQEAIDMSYYMGGEGRRLHRPDDAERAARQVHDERAHAGRRRRRDHALELPDRDPGLEALPGARLRQHGRAEAGRGHAASRRALRRAARRGGRAAGRRQRRARLRRGGGRGARPPSRRAGDHLHRLARDRRRRHEGRRRRPQARPPRARRQERDHRHGRRRRRPRGRGHRLVGVRDDAASAAPRPRA